MFVASGIEIVEQMQCLASCAWVEFALVGQWWASLQTHLVRFLEDGVAVSGDVANVDQERCCQRGNDAANKVKVPAGTVLQGAVGAIASARICGSLSHNIIAFGVANTGAHLASCDVCTTAATPMYASQTAARAVMMRRIGSPLRRGVGAPFECKLMPRPSVSVGTDADTELGRDAAFWRRLIGETRAGDLSDRALWASCGAASVPARSDRLLGAS